MSPFDLHGEIALITGGGTGLGRAMALCMADAGARVVLTGRREEVLQQTVAEIGENACYEVQDVTELDRAPELVERVQQRVGPISILVNNAGIHLKKSAVETTDEEFAHVMDTHVMGAYALTRTVAKSMVKQQRGAILFTASMASLMGIPNVVAYATAKTAYLGLVRSLAVELAADGIRVNAIAPGWIESHMLRGALEDDPQRKQKILARTPMNQFGRAEDVGHAAVYLCSPAARFITGVVLPVDGGASIGF